MAGEQARNGRVWMSFLRYAVKGKFMRSPTATDPDPAGFSLSPRSSSTRSDQPQSTRPKSNRPASSGWMTTQRLAFSVGQFTGRGAAIPAVGDHLGGEELYLRAPVKNDFLQWAQLRAASADFLRPWEPIWPVDDLTQQGFRRRLEQYQHDRRVGRALPYLIFDREKDRLLGGINVSNIRRGICQSASIGYWMGEDHAGQGHMSRALALLLPYLFDCQGLHRVEAACLPINQASMAVLVKQGFKLEGKARSYLCINGRWEDHLLFSLLRSDLRSQNIPLGDCRNR